MPVWPQLETAASLEFWIGCRYNLDVRSGGKWHAPAETGDAKMKLGSRLAFSPGRRTKIWVPQRCHKNATMGVTRVPQGF